MSSLTLDQAYRLAVEHHGAGRLQQAEALYRQILQTVPDQPETLHMLGVLAYQVGHADAAVELIGKAVARNPNVPGALNNLGEAQRALKRFDDALRSYQRSIELEPGSPEAYSNLGLVLGELRRTDEARASFEKALSIKPNFSQCRSNYGNLLVALGQFDEGIAQYRRAIADMPAYAPPYNNLGSALEKVSQLADSEAAYRKAVELEPRFAEAWNNLGSLIRKTARFDEALTCFERALAIDPNHAGAGWNAGLVYLTRGDYARGWEGYERRFLIPYLQPDRGFSQPRWDGSALNGRTLFVHSEQGFGDLLQAARYLPMLAQRKGDPPGRVVVEAHRELIDLFRNLEGIDELIEAGQPPPSFDVVIPVFSLPRTFGTRLDTIPTAVPYLQADSADIARFAQLLQGASGRKKIGLVWAGKTVPDPLRSIPPEALAPLSRRVPPNCSLVSLQVGESSAASLPNELREKVIDLGADLKRFADTAAAMVNLDLIVTIDTAAAHLAGALGRPTWTLVPFSPDWRWMTGREDSPWYPTVRLFRQTRHGDWTDAIERVADELKQFAAI